jgi:eukaryotic-like serine/threonine-protein kinase
LRPPAASPAFGSDAPTPSMRPPTDAFSEDATPNLRLPSSDSDAAEFPDDPTPDLKYPRDPSTPHQAKGGGLHPRRGRTLIQYTPPPPLGQGSTPDKSSSALTPPPGTAPTLEPQIQGQRFGRYVLTGLLAEGGMATVHHALLRDDSGFEKPLAIKCMRRELSQDPEFVRRFVDEARIASTLGHSNIVQVFDFGMADSRYFLAMELVQGPDLGSLLDRLAKARRSMPVPAVLQVAIGALRGLGAAHRRVDAQGNAAPVVHRDISPQNILISLAGEVKVADFGIAKAASNLVQTRAGVVMGKFFYMSPEQAMGLPVDPRSDIFAIGAVLYEMLAGRPLWHGKSPEELVRQVLNAPLPGLSQLGGPDAPELGKILERVLSREPAHRPVDGNTLARELESLLHRLRPGYSRDDLADLVAEVEGTQAPGSPAPAVASARPGVWNAEDDGSPSLDDLLERWPEQPPEEQAPPVAHSGARGVELARDPTLVHPLEDSGESLIPSPAVSKTTPVAPRRGWTSVVLVLSLALILGVGVGAGLGLAGAPPAVKALKLGPGLTVRHGAWSLSIKGAGAVPNATEPRFMVQLWLGKTRDLPPTAGRLFTLRGEPALFWTSAKVQDDTIMRLVFAGRPGPLIFAPPGEPAARLDLAY